MLDLLLVYFLFFNSNIFSIEKFSTHRHYIFCIQRVKLKFLRIFLCQLHITNLKHLLYLAFYLLLVIIIFILSNTPTILKMIALFWLWVSILCNVKIISLLNFGRFFAKNYGFLFYIHNIIKLILNLLISFINLVNIFFHMLLDNIYVKIVESINIRSVFFPDQRISLFLPHF